MAVGLRGVSCPQGQAAVIGVRKTGLGTPVLSGLCANFCTITDNGVGDYTIVVNTKRPFEQGCIATVGLHQTGTYQVVVAGSSKLQIQIKTYAVDGTTAEEKDFDLIVLGTYSKDYNS